MCHGWIWSDWSKSVNFDQSGIWNHYLVVRRSTNWHIPILSGPVISIDLSRYSTKRSVNPWSDEIFCCQVPGNGRFFIDTFTMVEENFDLTKMKDILGKKTEIFRSQIWFTYNLTCEKGSSFQVETVPSRYPFYFPLHLFLGKPNTLLERENL